MIWPLFSDETTEQQTIDRDSWYTPAEIINAALRTMGGIDLDPASCFEANQTVQARRFFTAADDGLKQPWHSAGLFLNPPYSQTAIWIEKLFIEYQAGRCNQAVVVINTFSEQRWYQLLCDWPLCLVEGRVKFSRPAVEQRKDQPRYPTTIAYVGQRQRSFYREFRPLGKVMMPAVESLMVEL